MDKKEQENIKSVESSNSTENMDLDKKENRNESEEALKPIEISDKTEPEQAQKNKKNKTTIIIVALSIVILLLIIALVGSFISLNHKFNSIASENKTEENGESQTQTVATSSETTEFSSEKEVLSLLTDEVSLALVDSESFPEIEVVFDLNTDKEIVEEDLNFTVKENQKIIEDVKVGILRSGSDTQLIFNYTSEYINNTFNAQNVSIDFNIASVDIPFTYLVPARQELSPRYVCYNTDNYPEVTMYFSFMGINEEITNAILENPEYYKLYENGELITLNDISKLSGENGSLSIDIVMDTSSSMEGGRLNTIKDVASRFVQNMRMSQNDRLALMSFSDPYSINQYSFTNNTMSVKNQIENLYTTGGSTSLYKAMQEAVMKTAYNGQSGSKYIIVFTDGEDNDSGYVTAGTVINDALQYGVQIYAVGMTEDFQLRNIAESTGGEYFTVSDNLYQLYDLYESIYQKKKNQYVITYTSNIQEKQKRVVDMEYNSPLFTSVYQGEIIPKLIYDMDVIDCMREYQINWSRSLNELDATCLYNYTNPENRNENSCYKIAADQVKRKLKERNTYSDFSTPIFNLVAATKVSDTHYCLTVNKHFVQNYYENGRYKKTFYVGRTYDYNVIYKNNKWVVDSVTDLDVPAVFYMDDTFATLSDNQYN